MQEAKTDFGAQGHPDLQSEHQADRATQRNHVFKKEKKRENFTKMKSYYSKINVELLLIVIHKITVN